MKKSYSYGVLPQKIDFIEAFERECPEGHFKFERDRRVNNAAFSCEMLWREICEATLETSDESLQWVSDVLSVLGFEWV